MLCRMSADDPAADPLARIDTWLAAARATGQPEPEAMALATATADGAPSVRYVLYRGQSGGGLRFFTNRDSRKGHELAQNPRAAAVLLWPALGIQVRVEGAVERLGDAESDAYFAARPRGNQLSAWASPQSRPLSYDELEARYAEAERRHEGAPVPRPPYWGGYRLVAATVEVWERGDSRLHRRTLWTRTPDGWQATSLAP
jgi:pyridoxamine 5'-phosphate oxidase